MMILPRFAIAGPSPLRSLPGRRRTAHQVSALALLAGLMCRGAGADVPPAPALHWLDGSAPSIPVGVTWGIPWARGALAPAQHPVIHSAGGNAVPTQSWPLAFWPDGSVKWSACAISADATMEAPLSVVMDATAVAAPSSLITDDGQSIMVATGPLRCRLTRHGSAIIDSLEIDGKEIASRGRLVVIREDRSQYDKEGILREEESLGRVDEVTIEQSGPVRAVVKITGLYLATPSARTWLPFTVRLIFTAGTTSIRMVHSFVFDGDAQSDFIRGIGLSFTVPFREEYQNRHIRFATDDDGIWAEPVLMSPGYRDVLVKDALAMQGQQLEGKRIPNLKQLTPETKAQFATIARWDSFKLSQIAPDAYSIAKRTGPGSSWLHAGDGHRARGLAFLGDVSGGLAIGMRRFWEKYPTSLEISGASEPAATMTVWFWSPDAQPMDLRHYDVVGHDGTISYEDHEDGFSTPFGVANTSELTLWACGDTPTNSDLAHIAQASAAPSLLVCDPQYYHDAGAFGPWSLPDRSTPDHIAIEDQLDRAWGFFANEVEQRHWYGFWDFGDFMRTYDPLRHRWLYDVGGHAWNNTELMSDAWLWYMFLRNGRADAFRLAEAMTRNTSEVDVYHIGRFAGIGSRHNVSHWGCGAKEVRISESFLKRFYYYLTGDERVGDLMRETLTVDEHIAQAAPLRHKLPRPEVPLVIRTGPDWTALASNWYTEWERTGDVRYRDFVAAGMRSLGSMPDAFADRLAFGFDLRTKTFTDIGEPNLKTYEFLVLFGGDQIMYDIMQDIDIPTFRTAWNRVLEVWARKNPDPSYTGSRIAAYMAHENHDPELGRKAWNQLCQSLHVKGVDRFPVSMQIVAGSHVPEPMTENPHVDTPGTAQWALSLIIGMEFLRTVH